MKRTRVRSLNSPVLKWLDAETVLQAVRKWADQVFVQHPGVLRVGLLGSYTRLEASLASASALS